MLSEPVISRRETVLEKRTDVATCQDLPLPGVEDLQLEVDAARRLRSAATAHACPVLP
jgi:hypothetical protein